MALATAPGEAALAVIRLSGPRAVEIASRIFRPGRGGRRAGPGELAESHRVHFGWVYRVDGEPVDEVIVTVMRSPRSYTREDVVEITGHGGSAAVRGILEAAVGAGARPAEPGEFTRRAFLNGRIDLSQAEAVMDLIRARTDLSRRAAARGLLGDLAERCRGLSERLVRLLAELEARIDYPEDDLGDLGDLEGGPWISGIREVTGDCRGLLATGGRGRILRQGLRTVIAGKANAGKSSLMNALLGRRRAIVSDLPGTTRDFLEESVSLAGVPVVLVDTAGLRRTEDVVEQIGLEMARDLIDGADLVLAVVDDSTGLEPEDVEILRELDRDSPADGSRRVAVLVNKCDLGMGRAGSEEIGSLLPGAEIIRVSALSGEGLSAVEEMVARIALNRNGGEDEVLLGSARQEDALRRAVGSLEEAVEGLAAGWPVDVAAVDLREALAALGEITGETASEAVVDEIFRRFCLGK